MPESADDHRIVVDEKGQEQPTTKERANDPSSPHIPTPDKGSCGKFSEDQRHVDPNKKT